jgi:hypothetical protein
LLSLIPKIFESIVVNKVLSDLNDVIVDDQHGFRRNKNTITNLKHFQYFVSNTLFQSSNMNGICTDFTTAFDKINHQILFIKLEQILCFWCFLWFFFILDNFFY